MTSRDFKTGIGRALQAIGFVYRSKRFERQTSEILTLLEFQKGFGAQWFINVGFWLYVIDPQPPPRVAAAHLVFRLERLLPDLREEILTAGALDDSEQASSYERLLARIPTCVDDVLKKL